MKQERVLWGLGGLAVGLVAGFMLALVLLSPSTPTATVAPTGIAMTETVSQEPTSVTFTPSPTSTPLPTNTPLPTDTATPLPPAISSVTVHLDVKTGKMTDAKGKAITKLTAPEGVRTVVISAPEDIRASFGPIIGSFGPGGATKYCPQGNCAEMRDIDPRISLYPSIPHARLLANVGGSILDCGLPQGDDGTVGCLIYVVEGQQVKLLVNDSIPKDNGGYFEVTLEFYP